MQVYLGRVMALSFLIHFLLLQGTNRLMGFPGDLWRLLMAGAIGGGYGAACLLPGFSFLGSLVWRAVSFGVMGMVAFGLSGSGLRRSVLFAVLSMALGGLTVNLGDGSFVSLFLCAVVLCGMCVLAVGGAVGNRRFVDVELCYGERKLKVMALQDTGNSLLDPVTGSSVLVLGADAAEKLLNIERRYLEHPVETVASGSIPGARLIPYTGLGQPCGLLLGLRLYNVRIGRWRGSAVVAFAPHGLDREGNYQALTGGMV